MKGLWVFFLYNRGVLGFSRASSKREKGFFEGSKLCHLEMREESLYTIWE